MKEKSSILVSDERNLQFLKFPSSNLVKRKHFFLYLQNLCPCNCDEASSPLDP